MRHEMRQRLQEFVTLPVQYDCSLSAYTSLAVGGPAEALVKVSSKEELHSLLKFFAEEKVNWQIIGKGTNLVVRDEGYDGVILLLTGEFASFRETESTGDVISLKVGGGVSLAKLAWHCADHGLTGLEFACGIPGTVGGAVIMNAGAWGSDIAQVLNTISVMTADGEISVPAQPDGFVYRQWLGFGDYRGNGVVVEIEMSLLRGNRDEIIARCKELQDKRKVNQPHQYPNAGSFFKNPPGDSAGRLIEASGLKGLKVGAVMVSPQHGNFIVNTGGATAKDLMHLMEIVQKTVQDRFGVVLEPEVHFL